MHFPCKSEMGETGVDQNPGNRRKLQEALKKTMKRRNIHAILVLLILALPLVSIGCDQGGYGGTARIGVLLPLSGDRPVAWEKVLDWGRDSLNAELGSTGFKIEFVYGDTMGEDIDDLARELVGDDSIDLAIGPETSREALKVAPIFAKANKLFISPSATSDELFRAFAGQGYFARTCQSDVAQVRTILHVLSSQGTRKLSLIYENSTYGRTFNNWTGFFAREMGMELCSTANYAPGQDDMSPVVERALTGDPECVVAAAFPQDAAGIRLELLARRPQARLFLTDAGTQPSLITGLDDKAEGVEGVVPSSDPSSGFSSLRGAPPEFKSGSFAADAYDSLLLATYVMARQRSRGRGAGPRASFVDVVSGSGRKFGCGPEQAAQAVREILSGKLPDINGATGPLDYDKDYGVDPLETYFSHWKVAGGAFKTLETISSRGTTGAGILAPGKPAATTKPSPSHMSPIPAGNPSGYRPPRRKDLWAVLISTTSGMADYRRQADTLAVYNLLKKNGVKDDRIILFLVDDVKDDSGNKDMGDVHNRVGGHNLRKGAVVDYSGDSVTAENFVNALLQKKNENGSPVLGSDAGSEVFVYVNSDGENGDIFFARSPGLSGKELGRITGRMYEKKEYRRIFFAVESDDAESFCEYVRSPGAICLASSSRNETSIPTNYDGALYTWLADEFSYDFTGAVSRNMGLSIPDLYAEAYKRVGGSHAALLNCGRFGDVRSVRMSEFVSP